jgi:hypothetical protein
VCGSFFPSQLHRDKNGRSEFRFDTPPQKGKSKGKQNSIERERERGTDQIQEKERKTCYHQEDEE